MAEVEVFADPAAVARAAAVQVVELAAQAVAARGRFSVALSGGSTPKAPYELLATDEYARRIDWAHVHVFFGDERCVPPSDPQSNERVARIALLDRVALPPQNVHPMRCAADDPAWAAAAYERELRSFFATRSGGAVLRNVRFVQNSDTGTVRATSAGPAAEPAAAMGGPGTGAGLDEPLRTFDLVLLGMGANGHTASLFPGLTAVGETERWVVAERVEEVGQWRLTLTPPVINAAAVITFLVTGAEKAVMLRRVLEGRRDPDATPAQAIAPQHGGRLRWLVDAAAAADLEEAVST